MEEEDELSLYLESLMGKLNKDEIEEIERLANLRKREKVIEAVKIAGNLSTMIREERNKI